MTRLGPYEVLEEIARGGAGVVFRCRDPVGAPAAVKVLAHVDTQDPGARRALTRQARELEALKRLSHPCLVRVLDAGEAGGRPWIAMELVEGPSLEERLRHGTFTPAAAADLVRRLAEGLEHAHQAGVLHRDVKPANVLLAPDGRPCLTDFGLAKLHHSRELTRVSHSGMCQGTPGFWPPEQARGDLEQIGPAADIYGLGATLYALLTGEAPFDRDSLVACVLATCEEEPRRPSELARVDHALEAICLRCLEKDPARRYPSAKALADELERYLSGELRAGPASSARWVAAAALVALVLVALVAALWARAAPAGRTGEDQAAAPADEEAAAPEYFAPRELPGAGVDAAPRDPPPSSVEPPALREEVRRARALLRRDPERARAILTQVLEHDPRFLPALVARGHLLRQQGELRAALADFDRAIELEPGDHGHWNNRGIVRMDLGELEAALEDFDRALALREDASTHFNRGIVRGRLGDMQGALEDHDAAILLEPDDALAWTNRGTAKETLGDLDGAYADHTRALELDPDDGGAYYNRGVVSIKRGDLTGAIADLQRASRSRPRDPQVQAALATAFAQRGELRAARACYRRAVEIDPEYQVAWYNLACLDAREGKLEDARERLSRAIEAGYANAEHMQRDSDLEVLRALPWFEPLVQRARANRSPEPPSRGR